MGHRIDDTARELRRNGQHWRAVQPRIGDTSYQISGARTQRGDTKARNAGHLSYHLRHPRRARFMAGEQKSHARLPARVDKRYDFAARQAESKMDATLSEGLGHGFRVGRHPFLT